MTDAELLDFVWRNIDRADVRVAYSVMAEAINQQRRAECKVIEKRAELERLAARKGQGSEAATSVQPRQH